MKSMFAGLALSLLATAALANGTFWTGETQAVRFAAEGGTVEVCSYWPIYPAIPGTLQTEWKCTYHQTFGGRHAVLVDDLPLSGETKVTGPRWCEKLDPDGIWRAMSKD